MRINLKFGNIIIQLYANGERGNLRLSEIENEVTVGNLINEVNLFFKNNKQYVLDGNNFDEFARKTGGYGVIRFKKKEV